MKARLLVLLLVFLTSLGWLALLASLAPTTSQSGQTLHFPSSLDDLRTLSVLLVQYDTSYVLLLFCSAYLFKQTFAVPGSVFMNVLAGAVFGLPGGFLLCSTLTAVGASCCYLLAKFGGRALAEKYFPHRLESFKEKLQQNRDGLSYFLLFLRLFPMSPNWAINMSCGVLEVPIQKFFLTVFFGLMPYNYICVQTGVLLTQLSSIQDIFTWSTLLQLSGIAFVVLVPGLIGRKRKAAEI